MAIPSVELFYEAVTARAAEIEDCTNRLVATLKKHDELELAVDVLELAVLNQNLVTLYRDMLLAVVEAHSA
jgi:hypothetical protein